MAKKTSAARSAARRPGARKKKAARELINTGRDKRLVRRDEKGQFHESDDLGRSLAQDRRGRAKRVVKARHGDRGDQARR